MTEPSCLEDKYLASNFNSYNVKKILKGSSAARLYVLEKDNTNIVLKIACTKGIDNGNEKLVGEIEFLDNLPSKLRENFITVLNKKIDGETVWYTMPYLDKYQTIKELIDRESECRYLFNNFFEFMITEMYSKNLRKVESANYIRDRNIHRVTSRLAAACYLDPDFDHLVNHDYLLINGRRYDNYGNIFKKIISNYSHYLTVDFATLIHKDLSIENVLVDWPTKRFIIIDPRGPGEPKDYDDYVYDLAKFSYTLNGFTAIKYDQFCLTQSGTSNRYEFSINQKKKSLFETYYEVFGDTLQKYLPDFFPSDETWRYRLIFTEACHYLSNVPCFLENGTGVKKATALYLQGIILLNRFMSLVSEADGLIQESTLSF